MGFWWKKKIILIFFLITKFLDQLIILSLDYEFKIKPENFVQLKSLIGGKKTVEYIFFIFLYYKVVHLILYQNLVLRQ